MATEQAYKPLGLQTFPRALQARSRGCRKVYVGKVYVFCFSLDKILQHPAPRAEKSNQQTVESMPSSNMTIPTPLEAQTGPKRPRRLLTGEGSKSRGVAEFCPSTVCARALLGAYPGLDRPGAPRVGRRLERELGASQQESATHRRQIQMHALDSARYSQSRLS